MLLALWKGEIASERHVPVLQHEPLMITLLSTDGFPHEDIYLLKEVEKEDGVKEDDLLEPIQRIVPDDSMADDPHTMNFHWPWGFTQTGTRRFEVSQIRRGMVIQQIIIFFDVTEGKEVFVPRHRVHWFYAVYAILAALILAMVFFMVGRVTRNKNGDRQTNTVQLAHRDTPSTVSAKVVSCPSLICPIPPDCPVCEKCVVATTKVEPPSPAETSAKNTPPVRVRIMTPKPPAKPPQTPKGPEEVGVTYYP